MMDVIRVMLQVPSVGREFEIAFSGKLPLKKLLPLVTAGVSYMTDGRFTDFEKKAVFYEDQSGAGYCMEATAEELGIEEQAKIWLI